MCDLGALLGLLTSAGTLIVAATVTIGIAAALNNGFFSAPGSPAVMVTAGGLILAAAGALAAARVLAEDYFQCMGAPPACLGEFNNFISNIDALITVLGIQATASFVAAGIAWIPWAGAAPMYVIIGTLVIQAALIPSLIAFWVALENCLEEAASATVGPLTAPVATYVATSFVLALLAVGAAYYGRRFYRVLDNQDIN